VRGISRAAQEKVSYVPKGVHQRNLNAVYI
jgi:hypothetical protein